jgi:hypothetical protein
MVFLAVSDSSGVEFYSEKQDEIKKKFLRRYKALLSWINSNNVELKFLTVEEFQELRYDHSLNFSINMLILNDLCVNITCEQLKGILNSLKFTILSLKNYDPIPDGLLETCSEFSTLQCLQVENSKILSNLNLEETYFKNIIFRRVYFNLCSDVRINVDMPLCLKRFHMNFELQGFDNGGHIEFWMNQCKCIKEL